MNWNRIREERKKKGYTLAQVAREGPHQYSVTWGAQNFREALARKQSRYMGRTIDPDKEIVATCGSTEAMMCAMMTICNPGDKVMVFMRTMGQPPSSPGRSPSMCHCTRPPSPSTWTSWRLPSANVPRPWCCATPPTPADGSSPGRSC